MSEKHCIDDRLGHFGLELHPEKTRLVDFRRGSKESFYFLGLRFYWGRSKWGRIIPKVRSDGARMRRKMKELHQVCKSIRHWEVKDQHRRLCQVMVGYRGYYGISFNTESLSTMFNFIKTTWLYWLNRRGSRKAFTWEKFDLLLEKYPLPKPLIIHKLF